MLELCAPAGLFHLARFCLVVLPHATVAFGAAGFIIVGMSRAPSDAAIRALDRRKGGAAVVAYFTLLCLGIAAVCAAHFVKLQAPPHCPPVSQAIPEVAP